ncbi:DNA topoisomerase 1 isoform X1 [Dioscorea cayenensis subsp. rotundata]|uniref:DNA topoisomerase 1 isoform X1 n=1 Tax=Dioscorea cayennensis subsp. rotundata TaxID=55577 RepID=A0AB40BLM8_DIOCR|nr:DNA topoisomerase 1 isoform X1 [Dioscorea cayenensis subsp. rotundata]
MRQCKLRSVLCFILSHAIRFLDWYHCLISQFSPFRLGGDVVERPLQADILVRGPSILDVGLQVIRAVTDHQAIHVREIDPTPRTIGGTGHTQGQDHHTTGVAVSHLSMRHRSYSRDSRSYSPVRRHYYRSDSRSISPRVSYSPVRRSRYRSDSRSISPRVQRHSRSVSPGGRNKSYSRSISPRPIRRTSRRSYSRSYSPKPRHSRRMSYSRSYSPRMRRSKRSRSRDASPQRNKSSRRYSRESYSHSRSVGSLSKSVSSSPSRSG